MARLAAKATPIETERENPQLEIVKSGGTLVKLENNVQMAVAVQKLRDEAVIWVGQLALTLLSRSSLMVRISFYTATQGGTR